MDDRRPLCVFISIPSALETQKTLPENNPETTLGESRRRPRRRGCERLCSRSSHAYMRVVTSTKCSRPAAFLFSHRQSLECCLQSITSTPYSKE